MARVEVPVTVIRTDGTPVNGATVAVTYRSTGATAPWYATETGGVGQTTPMTTDAQGRTTGWVERGAYNLTISGTGITTYVEPFDAAPGSDATVDSLWLPDNAVEQRHLKDNSVGTAEVKDGEITNGKIASGLDAAKLTTGTLPVARIPAGAIDIARLASGVGARLLGVALLNPFTIGANASVSLATMACAHNGKSAVAFAMITAHSIETTSATALKIYVDGANPQYPGGVGIGGARSASLAATYSSGVLTGNHNWSVSVENGNVPTTVIGHGHGLLAVFELY